LKVGEISIGKYAPFPFEGFFVGIFIGLFFHVELFGVRIQDQSPILESLAEVEVTVFIVVVLGTGVPIHESSIS
jgi:hypothetical protein